MDSFIIWSVELGISARVFSVFETLALFRLTSIHITTNDRVFRMSVEMAACGWKEGLGAESESCVDSPQSTSAAGFREFDFKAML